MVKRFPIIFSTCLLLLLITFADEVRSAKCETRSAKSEVRSAKEKENSESRIQNSLLSSFALRSSSFVLAQTSSPKTQAATPSSEGALKVGYLLSGSDLEPVRPLIEQLIQTLKSNPAVMKAMKDLDYS